MTNREIARLEAENAKRQKPHIRYGFAANPQPCDPDGYFVGGYNSRRARWEPLLAIDGGQVVRMTGVLEIDGKVAFDGPWEEVSLGETSPAGV